VGESQSCVYCINGGAAALSANTRVQSRNWIVDEKWVLKHERDAAAEAIGQHRPATYYDLRVGN
jgi:hypothetical protein